MCSVAQFTTDDIGLLWLKSPSQTTAALAYLRTISTNSSYGILGETSRQLRSRAIFRPLKSIPLKFAACEACTRLLLYRFTNSP